ncbi:YqzM family protein [Thalassobacillus hwangdonensis]|uniref:YqzM family protein n=1 Tax=Thalassobacillus hwangdonensis TaxID=546108 RepID=A0ABW3L0C2_9BACI
MNEFKKEIQSKNNDVIDSGLGFVFSFLFFFIIFGIGVAISVFGM